MREWCVPQDVAQCGHAQHSILRLVDINLRHILSKVAICAICTEFSDYVPSTLHFDETPKGDITNFFSIHENMLFVNIMFY